MSVAVTRPTGVASLRRRVVVTLLTCATGIVCCLSGGVAGCAKATRVMLFEQPSPDGRQIVRVDELAIGEMSTVGARYEISVVRKELPAGQVVHSRRIWQAYRIAPVDVVWVSPTELNVFVSQTEYQEYAWSIKESHKEGISIVVKRLFRADAEKRARLKYLP